MEPVWFLLLLACDGVEAAQKISGLYNVTDQNQTTPTEPNGNQTGNKSCCGSSNNDDYSKDYIVVKRLCRFLLACENPRKTLDSLEGTNNINSTTNSTVSNGSANDQVNGTGDQETPTVSPNNQTMAGNNSSDNGNATSTPGTTDPNGGTNGTAGNSTAGGSQGNGSGGNSTAGNGTVDGSGGNSTAGNGTVDGSGGNSTAGNGTAGNSTTGDPNQGSGTVGGSGGNSTNGNGTAGNSTSTDPTVNYNGTGTVNINVPCDSLGPCRCLTVPVRICCAGNSSNGSCCYNFRLCIRTPPGQQGPGDVSPVESGGSEEESGGEGGSEGGEEEVQGEGDEGETGGQTESDEGGQEGGQEGEQGEGNEVSQPEASPCGSANTPKPQTPVQNKNGTTTQNTKKYRPCYYPSYYHVNVANARRPFLNMNIRKIRNSTRSQNIYTDEASPLVLDECW